jgi:hypothetical protein
MISAGRVIGEYRDYGFIGAITKPGYANELKELLEKVYGKEISNRSGYSRS